MKKLVVIVSMFIASTNLFASTLPHDLGIAVKNVMQTQSHAKVTSLPMIYVGQDISRPIVATANEPLWSGQRSLIG